MFQPSHFEWDEQKARLNERKHGHSFVSGGKVFSDRRRVEWCVTREVDREPRWKVVGQVEGMLLVVVFTMREHVCRIISVRRTNKAEERRYGDRPLHAE